jgi:O-acetyl-ADP-ribose deacetylase (regulator of RNase III)
MSKLHYTWRIGTITFHLVHGDIFQAPVESIVNSEQTDFILAHNTQSISGQIRARIGNVVQEELDGQTQGKILNPGVVLTTSGGETYRKVFHAGFHHPTVWLDESSEDNGTEHLQVIRRCVRQVLDLARAESLASTAFPLIGAGVFGLDPRLVAHGFFEDVMQFASGFESERRVEIWLVVYEEPVFHMALEAGVQAWLAYTSKTNRWEPFELGVPHLDLFEKQMVREPHPKWAVWMLLRYAELVTGYALSTMAVRQGLAPEHVFKEQGKPITFGAARREAKKLAEQLTATRPLNDWCTFLAKLIQEAVQKQVIHRINDDRNAIAHGREARQVQQIREDIASLVRISDWKALLKERQPPNHAQLGPWAVGRPDVPVEEGVAVENVGVFEKWKPGRRSYIVPWSGAYFDAEMKN